MISDIHPVTVLLSETEGRSSHTTLLYQNLLFTAMVFCIYFLLGCTRGTFFHQKTRDSRGEVCYNTVQAAAYVPVCPAAGSFVPRQTLKKGVSRPCPC